jgi:oxygen-independent coproporphyrinogen-3 oxidase
MERDGLLEIDQKSMHVMPKGRLLIRNICMTFDAYLKGATSSFSKVI